MVAYSFQPMFIDPILEGTKCQTIRPVGKRRHAVAGDQLQLYTGMRTKHCRLIRTVRCLSVSPITLYLSKDEILTLVEDGWGDFTVDTFARRDGFQNWEELKAFWAKHHKGVDVFDGLLIRWSRPPQ
jgi:hypothetical protein